MFRSSASAAPALRGAHRFIPAAGPIPTASTAISKPPRTIGDTGTTRTRKIAHNGTRIMIARRSRNSCEGCRHKCCSPCPSLGDRRPVVNAASGITTASRTWNTSLMVELMISI